MSTFTAERVRVGSVAELQARGCTLISGGGHGIAVFAHDGRFYAVDNRCPHMGFPLNRGTVRDGLLTCHWHHARFDLDGGGTLDPFADNVRTFPVQIEADSVFVVLDDEARVQSTSRWLGRLDEGLEHGLEFVMAKSAIALVSSGAASADVLRTIGHYGLRYRQHGWSMGMSILTALGAALPALAPEDRPLALFHAAVRVAEDTRNRAPRFDLEPLPATRVSADRLKAWFRRAIEVRDQDGAERILQTAIAAGASPTTLADLLLVAATDHVYLDGGHTVDYINKACEYLDLVGWSEAKLVLPSLVSGLAGAQRSEEQNAWRHPVDLIDLLAPHLDRLAALTPGDAPLGAGFDALAASVLDDDPDVGLEAISAALEGGIELAEVGQAVAHAAVLRVGRFHTSNEFSDWDSVHNTWTAAQALARALGRAPSKLLGRGLYHQALRVYLDRFLNIPAARLPDERRAALAARADSGTGAEAERVSSAVGDELAGSKPRGVGRVAAGLAGVGVPGVSGADLASGEPLVEAGPVAARLDEERAVAQQPPAGPRGGEPRDGEASAVMPPRVERPDDELPDQELVSAERLRKNDVAEERLGGDQPGADLAGAERPAADGQGGGLRLAADWQREATRLGADGPGAERHPDERPAETQDASLRQPNRTPQLGPLELLELLDREQQVAPAAVLTDSALEHGDGDAFIRVLGHAVLREDAGFHAYQTLEAGITQFRALSGSHPLAARRTLVGVTRYVAAHAPTPRALYQTYRIAERLLRGEDLTVATDEDSMA
jgi:nitrite reductase/ring-hydroxylating ferredoxin subunit